MKPSRCPYKGVCLMERCPERVRDCSIWKGLAEAGYKPQLLREERPNHQEFYTSEKKGLEDIDEE